MSESIHGHDVMEMMIAAKQSFTKESLEQTIVEKFGKELLNRQQRKKPWLKKFGNGLQYDYFLRAGYTAIRFSTYSEEPASVQEVIDRFRGSRINVSKCLKKINTDPFLPRPKTYDYTYMVI